MARNFETARGKAANHVLFKNGTALENLDDLILREIGLDSILLRLNNMKTKTQRLQNFHGGVAYM